MPSSKRYTHTPIITMTTAVPSLLLLLCLGASLSRAADNELVTCRHDWQTLYPASDTCLAYRSYKVTWYYAKYLCHHWDSTLFYPEDDADFNSTVAELNAHGASSAWLGACKRNNGNYITSDGQDFTPIWTGNLGLTDSANQVGFLEVGHTPPYFAYDRYDYVQYWGWYWFRTLAKNRFICGEKGCRIDCDRLCALIEALEALLH